MDQPVDLPELDDDAPSEQTTAQSATDAWELFVRHGDVAYRLARLLGADEAEAADVLEDVFVGIGRAGTAGPAGSEGPTAPADVVPAHDDSTSRRREVLTLVCRRLSAPPTDPCLRRVINILGETADEAA